MLSGNKRRTGLALTPDAKTCSPRQLRIRPKLEQDVLQGFQESMQERKLVTPFTASDRVPSCFLKDIDCEYSQDNTYLAVLNAHERDSRVVAVDDPHLYFIDQSCKDIMSCTTFVHAFFPCFNSVEMAKKITQSKTFAQCNHRKSYKYHNCNSFQDVLAKWDTWRDLGTNLHNTIEKYLNGEPVTVCPENVTPFQYFKKVLQNKQFWSWTHYRTEWAVFHEELKLCGKIDYVGRDPVSGDLIIVDWKRVSNISDSSFSRWSQSGATEHGFGPCAELESCSYIHYSLQLNTYKWIIEEKYGMAVRAMYLVQLHPECKQPIVFKVPLLTSYVHAMTSTRLAMLASAEAQVLDVEASQQTIPE